MKWSITRIFSAWWWVFAVIAISFLVYLQGAKEKKQTMVSLDQRIEKLENEKIEALGEQKELELHIESQSDPAYVEMMLMKELGVVPEGQQKVTFEK